MLNIIIAIVALYFVVVIFSPMGEEDLGAPAKKIAKNVSNGIKKITKKIKTKSRESKMKGDGAKLFNRTQVLVKKFWRALTK